MQWLQRGRQLGQAVKNVGRLRQILAVFARYGFGDIVDRMNLTRYLPSRLVSFTEAGEDQSTPQRLRMAFEELGPTFVKLGQLLSTRPDLVPEEFIKELTKLQDNVRPLAYETVRAAIERELGKPVDVAFARFNTEPLAAASISQVHVAELKTGQQVVVKVQRPEIRQVIDQDISLLSFLAKLLERYVPETRIASPSVFVDEFFRTLSYELDFLVEANNIAKIAVNMASIPEIVIPRVYKELSTARVLTLERFEGIRVNDAKALDAAGIDRKRVVQVGARAFFKSVMLDGLFHGDLHGGNLFVLPGDRLGIIDFGIVGRLSRRSRDQLANMMMALVTEDYETLCYLYADLGSANASVDFDAFSREVRNTLSPYMGLSLSELNAGKVLIEATKIAARYQIKVPGDWMIVFKAILTIEGMGRTLDPHFDLLAAGQEMTRELVKNQYAPARLAKDAAWFAKDLGALLQVLPRQIRWMFRKFNSDDFAFEFKSPELRDLITLLERSGMRQAYGHVIAGLVVASALTLQFQGGARMLGMPALSFGFLVAAVVLALRWLLI